MYLLVFQTPFTTQPAVAAHIPKSRPISGSQAAVAKRGRHGDRSHVGTSIPHKQQQPLDLCVVSGRIVSLLYIRGVSASLNNFILVQLYHTQYSQLFIYCHYRYHQRGNCRCIVNNS